MWLVLISAAKLLINSKLTAFIKEHLQACIIAAICAISLYSAYNLGAEGVRKEWNAEKAETAKLIAQRAADNGILAATLKGNYHATLLGIDNQFNLDNSVSADFGAAFGQAATASGAANPAAGGGISATGAAIAAERKSIADALTGIAKERNLLAKHAKTNTVKLINLQTFSDESK